MKEKNEQETRMKALEMAIEISLPLTSAENLVKTAKVFESYFLISSTPSQNLTE